MTRRLAVDREWTSFGDPIHSRIDLTGSAIFVGYGITVPELGYDDYRGGGAKGKIAVILTGTSPGFPSDWLPLWNNAARRRNAARHGAIGTIFIRGNPGGQPFDAAVVKNPLTQWIDREGNAQNAVSALSAPGTIVNVAALDVFFEGVGRPVAAALSAANSKAFQAFDLPVTITTHQETTYKALESPNVVAIYLPVTYDFKDVVALGSERSTIGRVVADVARSMQLELSPDPTPEQNFFLRSDQLSFVLRGVPAVFMSEGEKAADPGVDGARMTREWFERYYHAPNDDMKQPLNFKAAVRGTRLHVAVVYGLAQKDERPVWKSGDVFATLAAKRK